VSSPLDLTLQAVLELLAPRVKAWVNVRAVDAVVFEVGAGETAAEALFEAADAQEAAVWHASLGPHLVKDQVPLTRRAQRGRQGSDPTVVARRREVPWPQTTLEPAAPHPTTGGGESAAV
jgi:hypothetical protein